MDVSELIEALEKLPGDLEVLVSQDEEGNGFNKLYSGPAVYWIENNADKHGYVETVYDEDEVADYPEDHEQRVVIWP